jgi:hypothetical protein
MSTVGRDFFVNTMSENLGMEGGMAEVTANKIISDNPKVIEFFREEVGKCRCLLEQYDRSDSPLE